jgi:opacity protein-like surface antigen
MDSDWSFRVTPYAWLTAIDGDIGIRPLNAPVDISFSDTLDKLDMAYMFLVEAGYKRWSLTADYVYGDFSNNVAGGGVVFNSFRYEYTQWVLTPTVGYRVIETDDYSMDVFAGARVTSFDTTLTGRFVAGGRIQRSADDTWTDPIIGIRGQSELSGRLFLRYNADIGGFGVSSDLVWQAFLGLGYNITDNACVAVGYRGLGVDYSSNDYSTLDVVNHGPVIGFEFRF